jgi:hypothetical protein
MTWLCSSIHFIYFYPSICFMNWINLMYANATLLKNKHTMHCWLTYVNDSNCDVKICLIFLFSLVYKSRKKLASLKTNFSFFKTHFKCLMMKSLHSKKTNWVALICIFPFPSFLNSCLGETFRFHKYWM